MATVSTTGTESSSDSPLVSISMPRAWASSIMFSTRTIGRRNSASWEATSKVRRRFFASATWTITSGFSASRISHVTLSSSDCGTRLLTPGVSMTS